MNRLYVYGAMALGLLLTACSQDDLNSGNDNGIADSDQTLYVSLAITGDFTGTRASGENGSPEAESDFDQGTDDENAVSSAYFVFYDESGHVVGNVVPVTLPAKDETAEGSTVAVSYKQVVSVSIRKGEKKPAQVICYLNPIQSGTLNVSLNTIQTVSRSQVSSGDGFAMSNSVYYPAGEAEGSTPQIAAQIPSGLLRETESMAKQDLTNGNTVNIYVERYASKLAFNGTTATPYQTATRVYGTDGTTTTNVPVTLTFTPQYWAVNAQANRSYVIKSFRQESEDGILLGQDYQYSALNNIINVGENGTGTLSTVNSWDWNNPDYNRSYWGMSPAYYTETYPEVSSDLMGDDALEVNQTYISYNELGTKGFVATNTTPQYFRETTVGKKALSSSNPAAAVASVIYVGQYSLRVNGTSVEGNPSFYTYLTGQVEVDGTQVDRPYVYFDNDNTGASKVAGGESMLKRFLAQAQCFYKAETDGEGNTTYTRMTIGSDLTALVSALEVAEISDKVKTNYDGTSDTKLKLQNNARTLQLKSADLANSENIFILTGNGYQQVVADNVTPENGQITLTNANIAIMRQVGYAYYYTTGHAYFNIPVKHLGWYRKGNTQKSADKIDWNKVRVGDFGMVRNHSYSINVSEIKGLASGIGGDNVPIVPPAITDDYFVSYSVRILKWAVVPIQGVKL